MSLKTNSEQEDHKKPILQWVMTVKAFSSEYQGWPASNVCGQPNTYPNYGDLKTAWAPSQKNGTQEYLELLYKDFVMLQEVHVYETFNPGSLVKVTCYDEKGKSEILWQSKRDSNAPLKARIFKPAIKPSSFPTRHIRLDFDTRGAKSFSEIDAVAIVGIPYKPEVILEVKNESGVKDAVKLMFNNQKYSDISFIVGDKTFYAHKSIICQRSKILDEKIKDQSSITITEWNATTIEQVLKYLYTGEIVINSRNNESVLKCADRLGIADLRKHCFEYMVKNLTKDSVCQIMMKARRKEFDFEATDLITACINFLASKAFQVLESEGIFEFDEQIILEMVQNDKLCIDEIDLFNAVCKWGEHKLKQPENNGKTLSDIIGPMMKYIRWPLIEPDILVHKIKPTKLCPYDLYMKTIEYFAAGSKPPKGEEDCYLYKDRGKMFKGTTILTTGQSFQLIKWLGVGYEDSEWEVAWKGSKDGFNSNIFHQKCNGVGETITVIRSTDGWLFGGYNPDSWNSNSTYGSNPRCFIFSLKNKDGKGPVKIPFIPGKNGVYGSSGYGPTFGGGHDIYICSNCNTANSNYSNLGHSFDVQKALGYTYNSQQAKNFLAGSYNFTVSEIEVFKRKV